MKSHTIRSFRQCLAGLTKTVRKQAREAYRLFESDPNHPSLRFKRVHPSKQIYSARVSRGYRAVGVLSGQEIVWFWIGSHKEYERLIAKPLKKA